jgi:hypothetical protein
MQWRLWPRRTVQRRCLDCGESWVVTGRLARTKPPGRSQRGLSAGTARYGDSGAHAMTRANLDREMAEAHRRDAQADSELEFLRQARTCPKCGSEHYTKRA